jgi:hypothetical protein
MNSQNSTQPARDTQVDRELQQLHKQVEVLSIALGEIEGGTMTGLEQRLGRVAYLGAEVEAASDPRVSKEDREEAKAAPLVPLAQEIAERRAQVATISQRAGRLRERIEYITARIEL